MACGDVVAIGPRYAGCLKCPERGPLEVIYAPQDGKVRESKTGLGSIREELQPIDHDHLVDLGNGPTPLIVAPRLGPNVWVKNETVSPTWSHKDRANMVSASVAVLLGAQGIVATSTGNHGASAAAYAAAAGLRSIVFCHPKAPSVAVRMMRAFGGIPVRVDAEEQRRLVARLVDDGWLPSTSMDPHLSVRSNPFGVEGYKVIAYEIYEQLGRLPGAVVIPSASGDTAYGVLKGFREVTERTGLKPPRVVVAQPERTPALIVSLRAGRPVGVPLADTIALSVGDPETGRPIVEALLSSGGTAVAVSEEAIMGAVVDLARIGVYAEPASAVGLAAYRREISEGALAESEEAVLIITAAGTKWPDAMSDIVSDRVATSEESLFQELELSEALSGDLSDRRGQDGYR